MWYFILKQDDLKPDQYRALQQKAAQTDVELFNEPYANLCLFTVEDYSTFVDALDLAGLAYDVQSQPPSRDQLLEQQRTSVG